VSPACSTAKLPKACGERVTMFCVRMLGQRSAGKEPERMRDAGRTIRVEVGREGDGRWLAEVPALSGPLAYGRTRDEAIAKWKHWLCAFRRSGWSTASRRWIPGATEGCSRLIVEIARVHLQRGRRVDAPRNAPWQRSTGHPISGDFEPQGSQSPAI
jgi:hypothetical protein